MIVLERHFGLHGTTYRALPLSMQTLCSPEDILCQMQKYVAADGSVDGLHIEFQGACVYVRREEELRVLALLAAAHHNTLVEDSFKYEKGLDGHAYSREQFDNKVHKEIMVNEQPVNKKAASTTKNTLKEVTWDAEMHGDQFVFDATFEQHEDLLPWKDSRQEERFGWYM